MAQEYIDVQNVRQVVEKTVKQKPSISELTKIESPGKPTPRQLEKPGKTIKKKRRKSRAKASSSITKDVTPKEYTLIITEKPQAANKIATALADSKATQIKEGKVSYYELEHKGQKIVVANAVGHLFNLNYVKGQKGYPIFETEWIPSFEKKAGAFTKPYYNVLKKLSKRASNFIIATDYDIEGEVIGWNVLRFICNQPNASRMKYSTLTKPELIKSYQSLMPELDWGHAYAGEARHILDWLYGINLSRALMAAIKTSGSFKILSIGRVQGPALKVIVDREKEISAFKSEPYWNVYATVKKQKYKHPKDIFDKKQLDSFKDIKSGTAETTEKQESIQPQTPFDLTSLQREAYRWYKISPSATLKIAQKLYLSGLISYPRTSSQKIPDAINPKAIIKSLKKQFPTLVSKATRPKPIEGKKSDPAHPSIYPTGEPALLEDQEKKLYELIVKRFLSCFSPDLITANKRTKITADNKEKSTFTASGLKIIDKGWTQIYPASVEESEIPSLSGPVKISKIDFEEKETLPPRRYSPASLITTLEKKNLGTKATRSSIVDTLFDRGYLDGRSIKATPLGMKLIETLEKYSSIIIDENLTRSLEKQMEEIQKIKSSEKLPEKEQKIINEAKSVITDISKEFKEKERQIGKALLSGIENQREKEREENTIMPCPVCNKGNLQIRYSPKVRSYFVGCSSYPECRATYPLPPGGLVKNTGKTNESGLHILMSIKKGKRPWEFPFDPDWKKKNPDYKPKEYKEKFKKEESEKD
ncbi:DNA topoisomerase I [Candidatus Pacearchaeota archaeon]|nr:DNA topoisomerase I [Candidatus Pacearchaeota archaeon]|tara:strand:+ start:2585 stop:4867 length:2283 start_codon:yes stop_codon:yes gene_type:complete